jgi:dTDP-4-dehydrorhamnose reductase
MLGQDLRPRLQSAGFEVIGPEHSHLDITRPEQILLLFKNLAPALVINCAAYTAVDRAESEPDRARAVNQEGAGHLAEACRELGIPLLHLSTDYVFDGMANLPYQEDDPVNPLNVYGLTKWQGEEAIRFRLAAHLIVRTSWLYGVHGHNFVKTILKLAQEKEELRVVADQYGCSTWSGDLAEALVVMARHLRDGSGGINWGTYHFCGAGWTTWHGFAQAIVEEAQRRDLVQYIRVVPIPTPDYPTPARRPRWSVLDCQKIGSFFHVTPRPWRQGLADMLRELLNRGP